MLVRTTAIPTVMPVTIHGWRGRNSRRWARRKLDLDVAARDIEI
jgi:hypothetical protein